MTINEILQINKFGQNLVNIENIILPFIDFSLSKKREYMEDIVSLILQSKPENEDANIAIVESGLKPSFTPCVLLVKNGVKEFGLLKIVQLPESELIKSLILVLTLFKIAYKRRFALERNDPGKWWYWDLSDKENLIKIIQEYNI